ncbi:T9SS type B sorting domain-containing protein [Polaribacter sargassicola]|uniref:T9SS type B sorting domain-containing protein n=1 Tax=Polaribacter sargassicola TaxID=2836891 RepID=UPI001F273EF3|nr:T9SS type B sorting domain-containing protein [Polaribacter sp. DS7-9]MCG1035436.1 T9SS type B sorting domain-containing protein [Polaribacter sp. DS7-9]
MKRLLPLIILFFTLNSFSQKEANFWYFGNRAALDFNSGSPIPVTGSQLNTFEGCSSFSDADGNLLFYVGAPGNDDRTLTVWDKNNNPMPNGTGLRGDSSSSQSALTIPSPSNSNIYYLFTVGTTATGSSTGGISGFFLYEIDMSLNGGLGDINTTTGAINLSDNKDSNWTEKVTAVRAKDCNSYWVISLSERTGANGNNEFYTYKVDQNGVDIDNPVISELPGFRTSDVRGYLKVSPDGSTLVSANMGDGTYIFDFNDETGEVTNYNGAISANQLNLGVSNGGYGVEFSTSSNRLYISTGESSNSTENLYQFDLTLSSFSDINNSRTLIHTYFNSRGALQLGPDGKIYWSSNGSNSISVINNPDNLGSNVNYSHQSVSLGSAIASQGLPPFLSSLLLPIEIKDISTDEVINNQDLQFCIGDNKTIEPEDIVGINILYTWTLDNGTSVTTISSSATQQKLELNNITFADAGTYSLKVTLEDDCGNNIEYNATFNVDVFEAASAKKPENINFCDTDLNTPNQFDLESLKNSEILDGLDPATFDVLYFDSLEKATNNETGTNLPTPYEVNTVSTQTIYARVHNTNAPNGCYAITEFELEVTSEPTPEQPTNYRLCDDAESGSDSDGIINTFDLSSKDSEILGPLSPTQYNVSYHTSLADAQTSSSTNPINKNSNYSVTNSQTIYVRVENIDNPDCNAISDDSSGSTFTSFQLIVDPKPVLLTTLVELKQCANDINRNTIINLTQAEINITTDTTVTFEYYQTETDAINGDSSKLITDIQNYPVTNGFAEAGVRVISEQGCYSIVKIEITASYAGDVSYDKTFEACDDIVDADGNDSSIDGFTYFNFSAAEQEIINTFPSDFRDEIEVLFFETPEDRDAVVNQINDISNHRNNNSPDYAFNQTIYIKIKNKNNNDCEGIGQLYLKTNPIPEFTIEGENPNDPIILCAKNIPYTLAAITVNDYNYEWTKDGVVFGGNTQEINITEQGTYTVTAFSKTSTVCSITKTIVVLKSDFDTLEESYVIITDDTSGISGNLSIQINIPTNPLIEEEFQYALENENGVIIRPFQDSNIFNDIEGGFYKIIVENKDGCGTSELVVSVIQFPKFFTPNGDGKNDTWTIKGINNTFYPNGEIYIYNRYGKIVAQINIDGQGWDGTYNGKLLPSNDYWFSVQLISSDPDKQPIIKKGHFSLLRK